MGLQEGTTKHKKNKKRERQVSSDGEAAESPVKRTKHEDESEDEEPEEHEFDNDAPLNVSDLVPPLKILQHIESFRAFLAENKKSKLSAKHLKQQSLDYVRTKDVEEAEKVASSLLHYLKLSLRLGCISLDTGLRAMTDFLERGETVLAFPDYPTKPALALVLYGKKHNMALRVGDMKKVSEKMNADSKGRAEVEVEVEEANKKYLTSLEEFQRRHMEAEDLTPQQLDHLIGVITRLRKKLFPQPRPPRAANGGSKKKAASAEKKKFRTPFELYCSANPDKYTDAPEEKRLRKLQKKFDKLDDATRNLFVNMSLALD